MTMNYFIKSQKNKELFELFINKVYEDSETKLDHLQPKEIASALLITHPFTHRMIKKFIQGFEFASDHLKITLEEVIDDFVELMLEHAEILLETRAVFIFISLMENTSYVIKIANHIKSLDKFEELKKSESSGVKILIKLIKEKSI